MEFSDVQVIAALAAGLSAVATIAAAIAAFRSPITAAKLAEQLRRDAEAENRKQHTKMWVFTTIMQERAAIHSPNSVGALNLIDVVFNDSLPVREAWADAYIALGRQHELGWAVVDEKIRVLLIKMAENLKLDDQLRIDDIGRVYYPRSRAEEDEIANRRREQALQELRRGTSRADQESGQTPILDGWPPRPEAKNREDED